MASFKSHPLFFTSLLLAGALTAGQAWLLFSQRSATNRVTEEIAQKQEALNAFSRARPFPSKENLVAVEADLAVVQKTRDEIRGRLRAVGEVADKIAASVTPGSPTDAYFDIAGFVERVGEAAAKESVSVAADNRFGFSAYASTGPERDLVAPVFQQRLYADYLLNALLKSKPSSFVSLQRERPLTPQQKQQILDAIGGGLSAPTFSQGSGDGDYFSIDPSISARVPGFVETTPFRLTFTGLTESLRLFLNELVTFKVPVVVRSVEVEPSNRTDAPKAQQASAPAPSFDALFGGGEQASSATPLETAKALVERSESKFTVTLEIISLVDKSAAESAPAPESVPTP
ncbi:MAG: hypothetical protein H7067_01380 [Burkholderiales bacterium]|nr:hypothetical protein [Opitutaceae bacterium]